MNWFTTDDRRLEQFLYAHFIPYDHQEKDQRGHTVWYYTRSPRLFSVLDEYKTLCAQYAPERRL